VCYPLEGEPSASNGVAEDVEAIEEYDQEGIEKDLQGATPYIMDLSGTPGRFIGPNSFADSRSENDPKCPAPIH
jgi:hypothetical protein